MTTLSADDVPLARVGIGVWRWNPEDDRVACSDSLLEQHGLSRGAFDGTGSSLLDCVHPEDRALLRAAIRAASTDGSKFVLAYRTQCTDGAMRNIQVRGSADRRGGVTYVSGACVDLGDTARRADLEAFVAHSSEQLARADSVNDALDGVAQLAVERIADWCVIYLARGWQTDDPRELEPVGMARAEGQPTSLVHRLLEPPQIAVPKGVTAGRRAEVSAHRARWGETASNDMDRLGIEWWIDAPIERDGLHIGLVSMLGGARSLDLDLEACETSARVALQIGQALARLAFRQAAQEAIASRDEVLAIVSHDLRNLLNTIHMASSVLREDPSVEVDRRLDAIDRAVKRGDALISDLLEVAKVSGGSLALDPRRVRLRAIAHELRTLFDSQAESKGITFLVSAQEGDAVLDRRRVVQALVNLVGNAFRHTPQSGTVEVEIERLQSNWRFCVRDTGPGISPEQAPLLFEPFWQARKARKQGGAGLGLAIARGIVEAHRGRIWVESEPGQGARFIFVIPTTLTTDARSVSVIDS